MAYRFAAFVWAFVLCSGLAHAAPPLEAYGRLPGVDHVTLSPDGARYAMAGDAGQGRRLMVLDFAGHPLMSVNIGARRLIGLRWAGDDHLLAEFTTAVDAGPDAYEAKEALMSVVAINVATRSQIAIFEKNVSVKPAVLGEYGSARIGDRWYGFFGGETISVSPSGFDSEQYGNKHDEGDYTIILPDLYQVDLDSGAVRLVARSEPGGDGWLVGPDGQVAARTLRIQRTADWRVMSGPQGGVQLEAGRSAEGGADLLSFGQSGDTVLISHPTERGWVTGEVPLKGGPPKTVLDEASDQGILVDRASRGWIGLVADGDEDSYHLFAPAADARVSGARKAFPGYFTRLVSFSEDFGRMIIFTSGKDDAGTYWRVDIAGHAADPIGYPYPAVGAADVGPTRMVDFKAADGLALRGVLTLPPGREARALPLVVLPHGGPAGRDYPEFDWWAQAYASRGYAVFQPNFRGSTGYGEALRRAGDGEWGRKMQTDISDGVAELAREGVVDPKRACIVGGSYGGYAALAGVTVQHGLYRCAVSFAGISDIGKMYGDDARSSGYSADLTHALEEELGDKSRWAAVSPARLAAKADAPILLIHGKDDTVVPIRQSDDMERALRAANKPVERLTLPGGDHHLLGEDARIAMLKASVAFVEKYNPPDPVPASGPSR